MGGSSPRNTTTTTITEYPEWMQQAMQGNLQRANQLADNMDQQGYQTYNPSDRISGFNDYQLNAMNNAQQSVGNWTPLFQRGVDASGTGQSLATQAATAPAGNYNAQAAYAGPGSMVQTGSMAGTSLNAYMNPYNQAVTQTALGNLEDSRQAQNLVNSDAAAKARAFGGSRHGVVEAQTNAAFAKQAGDLALNSAQQNYSNAQNMAQADLNRNLQAQGMNQSSLNNMAQFNAGLAQQANLQNASQGLQQELAMRGIGLDAARALQTGGMQDAAMAGQYQGYNSNDLNNLLNMGNMVQDQDQLYRDFAYQEWLNGQNFPIDTLNLRYGAVTNTPYTGGSSTSAPIYRNRGMGFLGGAASGASMGSSFGPWGTAIGAIGGGLLGAYG